MKPIDITKQKENFIDFVKLPHNKRLIFSGIFGIGKTYFLKELFRNSSDYVPLHIFPTNYSVTRNEDIFELIKYDILYEVLKHKPPLEKIEPTTIDTLAWIDVNDIYPIFRKFIEMIPDIGKQTLEIISSLEVLFRKLREKKAELSLDEGKHIKSFARKMEMEKGGIYENDFYTQLITKLVENLKTDGKQVVLIVDDLDRIDPDHIFRILNIFAVHFDVSANEDTSNKFALDKIVLSCDIENIRKIFQYRYGHKVDFNGYIDKFYSTEVYRFDNTEIITGILYELIGSIRINSRPAFQRDENYKNALVTMLGSMVQSGTLNLRTLKGCSERLFSLSGKVAVVGNARLRPNSIRILDVFELLIQIIGSPERLLDVLERTTFTPFTWFHSAKDVLGDLIVLAAYRTHQFKNRTPSTADDRENLTFEADSYTYYYRLRRDAVGGSRRYVYGSAIKMVKDSTGERLDTVDDPEDVSIHYKELLLSAYTIYMGGLLQ